MEEQFFKKSIITEMKINFSLKFDGQIIFRKQVIMIISYLFNNSNYGS